MTETKPDSRHRILVVCTANRGRSPIAEALLKKKITELNATDRVAVESSGMSTHELGRTGAGADPTSLEAARRHGIDIEQHRARPFDPKQVDHFAAIIVMESWQVLALKTVFPQAASRIYTLRQLAGDVGDPTTPDVAGANANGLDVYIAEANRCLDTALKTGPLSKLLETPA